MFIWGRKGGQNIGRYYDIIIFNLKTNDQNKDIINIEWVHMSESFKQVHPSK